MRITQAVVLASASCAAAQSTPTLSNPDLANFSVITKDFSAVIGQTPSIELIHNATEPLFHEAGIFLNGTLFVSSNRIKVASDPATGDQTILLHAVTNVMSGDLSSIALDPISTSQVVLPNGGTLYGSSGLVFTSQGSKTASGGLFVIPDPLGSPNVSVPLVTDFYGKPFNSPNDVVVNPKDGGSVWFTDPDYGHLQGLRDAPVLPNQVYRFDPATNSTRVVADGFSRPNGLAFDAEFRTLYVTDTGGSEAPNGAGPATIYAFDVVTENGPFLANRRVFAYAPKGIPDGVCVDSQGNVWSGVGSGLAVWNRAGTLIGQVLVEGGVANFGFAPNGTVFVLNETNLWRVKLTGQSLF
ncbi:SMP-30/Gluconolaconase/LRE-like region [Apiospora phragmitis]|uniref:SMP-30/Gluconolaconase/LRE-like region n=1 Tax=Apiospora phragmitis TaxID=2905665 RepID=A0ABR1T928_9PEZI